MEEIPALLETPPEEERRRRREREACPLPLLLPSALQGPLVLSLAELSSEPAGKLVTREA